MIYDESIIAFEPELIRIRRHLHANPELRFEEQETSDYIANLLADWDIPVVRGIGGHGLVGVLRHGKSERAVGLRADMDALPMHPCRRANRRNARSFHGAKHRQAHAHR